MNLPIAQSILHGALRPSNLPDIAFHALARKFNNLPSNLNDIEKLFISELGNYAIFDFEKAIAINNIAPDEYTSIKEYTFKPKIEISKEESLQTPQTIFYNTIVNAEATRIKIALLNYSTVVQSDIDTRQELKETLRLIKSHIKKASETADTYYQDLQTNLVKLYYELTISFDVLLTENDFTTFEDLYLECFNRYPSDDELNAYQAAKLIHEAQTLIVLNNDIQKTQNLLGDICCSIELNPHNSTLFTVGIALENYLFLKQTNQAIPSFDQLINSDFVNLITKEQKSILRQRYEREEIAIDRANAIDDIFTELSFSNPIRNTLSITNNLSAFLNQQKDIYLKDPSAIYKVVIEKQISDSKKKPQPTVKPMQIKSKLAIAHKHLAFLNGVNPQNNERILSESDYKLMIAYIEHLIQFDSIPKITKKIPRANLGKTWFRYSIYLVHKELYSSIQDVWIEFMQQAFDEFSPKVVTFSTLKTKFSQQPSGYNQFIKKVLG
ncbi:MAG: hypothetical protein QMB99_09270 [Paludibacteraceae bacterium]